MDYKALQTENKVRKNNLVVLDRNDIDNLYHNYHLLCDEFKNYVKTSFGNFQEILFKITNFFNIFENTLNIDIIPFSLLYKESGINTFIVGNLNQNIKTDILLIHLQRMINFKKFAETYSHLLILFNSLKLLLCYDGECLEKLWEIIIYFTRLQLNEDVINFIYKNFKGIMNKSIKNRKTRIQLFEFIYSLVLSGNSFIGLFPMFINCIDQLLSNYEFGNKEILYTTEISNMIIQQDRNAFDILFEYNLFSFILKKPINETNKMRLSRLKFLTTLLNCKFDISYYKYIFSDENEFSFDIIFESKNDDDSTLLTSVIVFLSSFIPNYIEILWDNIKMPDLIDLMQSIIDTGKFDEKKTALLFMNNYLSYKNTYMLLQILKNDDFFAVLYNLLEAQDCELTIIIFDIIIRLIEDTRNNINLSKKLHSKFFENNFLDALENLINHENKEISEKSRIISKELVSFHY